MWISDKHGNLINTTWLISLYVTSDGATGYEVRGNTYNPDAGAGQETASFNNGATMTQNEAAALRDKLATLLGAFNPAT